MSIFNGATAGGSRENEKEQGKAIGKEKVNEKCTEASVLRESSGGWATELRKIQRATWTGIGFQNVAKYTMEWSNAGSEENCEQERASVRYQLSGKIVHSFSVNAMVDRWNGNGVRVMTQIKTLGGDWTVQIGKA